MRRALGENGAPPDEAAFARLVAKYREPLVRHVGQMMRVAADVEDLVQEAFVKAFGALELLARVRLLDVALPHRDEPLHRPHPPAPPQDGLDRPAHPDARRRGAGRDPGLDLPPGPRHRESQRGVILRDAVEALPEKYHRVIVMRHRDEMSYEDIAETLGLPLGTVKAHIFRARALLNRALKDRRDDLD